MCDIGVAIRGEWVGPSLLAVAASNSTVGTALLAWAEPVLVRRREPLI